MEESCRSSVFLEVVLVKEEPEWDVSEDSGGVSEASSQAVMYTEHGLKDEPVGFSDHVKEKFVKVEAVKEEAVKDEHEWKQSVSERATLYAGHMVKGELVLGPEGPQLRYGAFAFCVSAADTALGVAGGEQKPAASLGRGIEPVLRDCSVRLERVCAPVARPASCTTYAGKGSLIKTEFQKSSKCSSKGKTYLCPICRKTFAGKSHLMEHVVDHIHTPTSPEQEESYCDTSSEEEIDVVSLEPLQLQLPQALRPRRRRRARHVIVDQEEIDVVSIDTAPLPLAYSLRARRAGGARAAPASAAEPPEDDRRSMHNVVERLRRIRLQHLFDQLKEQIPATKGVRRSPKIVILREAVSLCRRFRETEIERKRLEKRQNKLLTYLKTLRTVVARASGRI